MGSQVINFLILPLKQAVGTHHFKQAPQQCFYKDILTILPLFSLKEASFLGSYDLSFHSLVNWSQQTES